MRFPPPTHPAGGGSLSGSCLLRPPFILEHRVHDLVGPLTLDDLVLHEVGFAPHAEALENPGRRRVAGVDVSALDLVIDAGPCGVEPSTVVDLTTGQPFILVLIAYTAAVALGLVAALRRSDRATLGRPDLGAAGRTGPVPS